MSGKDRIERATDVLRRLESEGYTPDAILNGEAGRCWIEEACGGDLKLAKEAFHMVHPSVRFLDVPGGEF